jgi:hypothetical protein
MVMQVQNSNDVVIIYLHNTISPNVFMLVVFSFLF